MNGMNCGDRSTKNTEGVSREGDDSHRDTSTVDRRRFCQEKVVYCREVAREAGHYHYAVHQGALLPGVPCAAIL